MCAGDNISPVVILGNVRVTCNVFNVQSFPCERNSKPDRVIYEKQLHVAIVSERTANILGHEFQITNHADTRAASHMTIFVLKR